MATKRAETRVDADALSMEVAFEYDAARGELGAAYVLRNAGPDVVAVFDRGDRQQVASGRLIAGAVPPPAFERGEPGDLTLVHAARPLPQPTPTLPPTPFAARLAAGESLRGAFSAALLAGPPRRLRWCLGVAGFEASAFDQPRTLDGVSLWRASFAAVERQRRICTPWFDMVAAAFVGGHGETPTWGRP